MSKTIIVSNRLPLQISVKNEKISVTPSVGGLATGLQSLHQAGNGYWVGWIGLSDEEIPCEFKRKEIQIITEERRCVPVNLSSKELELYYQKFSNETIWPLFHYFTEYANFDDDAWEMYKQVNQKFADKILEIAGENDLIWIQDYQLMLVPQYLKKNNPRLSIGFFLHIPFPSFEVFRLLPFRTEILLGLLGADLIGFHTASYKKHFLSTVKSILGCEISDQVVMYQNSLTHVGSFPMGIDYEKFENAAKAHKDQSTKDASTLQKELDQLKSTHENIKLVLSVDRLDYTKGMANRIRAFEIFLDHYPQYRTKVSLLMLAVPSRTKVPQYKSLKKEIDQLVGHVNGKYGGINWTPIWYFYRSMPFNNLIDLYTNCDIALITPLRDGMNLVAKEYIACRIDQKGVLILSEMAGAAEEMTDALLINPNNYEEIALALSEAVEMSEEEQQNRNINLQNRLKEFTVDKWANDFMKKLSSIKKLKNSQPTKNFENASLQYILNSYNKSIKRIFFLDYDGTLVGFKNDPQEVIPDFNLKLIIRNLLKDDSNEVVIVSGRDRMTLGSWWDSLPINIIAEHGLYFRKANDKWVSQYDFNNDWIPHLNSIFEVFTETVPGSFIECKENSIVWHYRAAEPQIAQKAILELNSLLLQFTTKYDLNILEGNKNIEILSNQVNKGTAVKKYLAERDFDFIIAIGDDRTDEFMFEKLPPNSITIKVGHQDTIAKYRMKDYLEVRYFLKQLCGKNIHIPSLALNTKH